MSSERAEIAIIMGSQSDWATMRHAAETLEALGIAHQAHHLGTPHARAALSIRQGRARPGFKVIIAGAGGAAHLPGMTAALTSLPVLGVPVESKALSGQDSLYSIVQMPAGIPVGTLAIGKAGAINAALLAAAVLALSDVALAGRLDAWRASQTAAVAERPSDANEVGRRMKSPLPPAKPSASSAAASLGACWRWPPPASATDTVILEPTGRLPGRATRQPADRGRLRRPGRARRAGALVLTWSPTSSRTCRWRPRPGWPNRLRSHRRRPRSRSRRTVSPKSGSSTLPEYPQRVILLWITIGDLAAALATLGGNGVLKTRRLGYDGKGQRVFRNAVDADVSGAWAAMGGVPLILELFVPFAREISVIAARTQGGALRAYDPSENVHRDGILHSSTVPAAISPATAASAREAAFAVMQALSYVGVIGVEFFVMADGALVANEIAPRVHNSGHWTEAACAISQFEQHIRAIAGLPLGETARHSDCVMENLIGDDIFRAPGLLGEPDLVLHLYGKSEARPGRKMGHFTRLMRRSS